MSRSATLGQGEVFPFHGLIVPPHWGRAIMDYYTSGHEGAFLRARAIDRIRQQPFF